ncbi:MAG: glutamate-cysteine ligase family protein, partial [Gemmatimonadota bacterium]
MKSLRERFTVGVEEEYQLVEPASGAMRSLGSAVRASDRTGEVEGEVQETMLEISTPIATTARELNVRLRERRFQAAAAAAAEDLDLLAIGSHPFSSWQRQHLSDAARPRMLETFFRQVLRQQHICGMHIHVGVPEEIDRVVLMNAIRAFSPHLLALSCSSPFHLGDDTGFASFRSIIWRAFPFAGAPPRFESPE